MWIHLDLFKHLIPLSFFHSWLPAPLFADCLRRTSEPHLNYFSWSLWTNTFKLQRCEQIHLSHNAVNKPIEEPSCSFKVKENFSIAIFKRKLFWASVIVKRRKCGSLFHFSHFGSHNTKVWWLLWHFGSNNTKGWWCSWQSIIILLWEQKCQKRRESARWSREARRVSKKIVLSVFQEKENCLDLILEMMDLSPRRF